MEEMKEELIEVSLEQLYTERIADDLEELKLAVIGDDRRKALLNEISVLSDKMTNLRQIDQEYWDKQERRRVDEEKNQAMIEVETKKLDVDWRKVAIELGKISISTVLPIIAYLTAIKWDQQFEMRPDGIHTTRISRELHLPNIFKK